MKKIFILLLTLIALPNVTVFSETKLSKKEKEQLVIYQENFAELGMLYSYTKSNNSFNIQLPTILIEDAVKSHDSIEEWKSFIENFRIKILATQKENLGAGYYTSIYTSYAPDYLIVAFKDDELLFDKISEYKESDSPLIFREWLKENTESR